MKNFDLKELLHIRQVSKCT